MAEPSIEALTTSTTVADEEHPDYVAGTVTDGVAGIDAFTPNPFPFPFPNPFPDPTPQPRPVPVPELPGDPNPFPGFPAPRFCGPVSGRYALKSSRSIVPGRPAPNPGIFPLRFLDVTVRVDVDRFHPQHRISIEVDRLFPSSRGHVIAEVDSDVCSAFNHRVITASITFREGPQSIIPGNRVRFTAARRTGIGYADWVIDLLDGTTVVKSYDLTFQSRFFDDVEFEIDRVANAGAPVTTCDTGDHPNRPANLPHETLSIATVYERAGFDVTMSPNATVVPTSGANSNGTWSDSEMHNAMVTFWSRFANRAQWAMWVLYAAQHDDGHDLGGIMFDSIGPNHRQGTAIFRDSFIQDVPANDPDPAAWRRRMEFWTAVHEIGHGFNLAHSWQKSLSQPFGRDPWLPLVDEPEARSFMNYPFRVQNGESAFFSDFDFRFSDDELIFMRHAPRRFVQMGNSDWFDNHGFEAPNALRASGRWKLEVRPNRDGASYRFLEPVSMELKLTNNSVQPVEVSEDMLRDGQHFEVYIGRAGGSTQRWRPLSSRLHKDHTATLEPGESIYGSHLVSTSTTGFTIDEPGFYKIQAAIHLGDEVVVSNVMRVFVDNPESGAEASIADDYFTEDVARAIAFKGAPALTGAHDTLAKLAESCADNPAACHAKLAMTSPDLTNYKTLSIGESRSDMAIRASSAKVTTTARAQRSLLLDDPNTAADTLGHIRYFDHLRELDEVMRDAGDVAGSADVLSATVDTMKARGVLDRIVENAERRLDRRQKAAAQSARKKAAKKK